jgi:hypothetical protein
MYIDFTISNAELYSIKIKSKGNKSQIYKAFYHEFQLYTKDMYMIIHL